MAEYIIETKDNRWEVICGLEIHCQIISKSKMFSGASTVFGADANEHVSFVDAGHARHAAGSERALCASGR